MGNLPRCADLIDGATARRCEGAARIENAVGGVAVPGLGAATVAAAIGDRAQRERRTWLGVPRWAGARPK